MHFVIFSIVTIVLTISVWQSESNRNCYNAKTCMHSGIERCGVDENGRLRKFLDMCDIHEFNCLQNTCNSNQ
ncbi:unnamed protein product [Spodoptera littoralis]|uniref:Uncharacterized protein n=1 Tax=Spodoptera littoralis TaxID=7109 RepID=A0A9P0HWU2_SPOLI|nr:unnamed protein product [Spodoptera littoralis]CAH1635981.1 unnamed protein product [Spodoptera littoralis]